MKKLPNGDIAVYSQFAGSILSLICGIALIIIIIFGYFAVPYKEGKNIVYILMAAPLLITAIVLLKTFFKPTPQFVISLDGIQFHRFNKLFNKSVKLSWNQINAIYYTKQWAGGGRSAYQADILLFKTKDNTIYQTNLSFIKAEEIQKLYDVFARHNFKITNPPVEKEDLKIAKSWPTGKSNCKELDNDTYLFFEKGLILNLIGAIILSVLIILGYFSKSIDPVGWFFMTLPLWILAIILGKNFFKPMPIFAISQDDIFFSTKLSPDTHAETIKWSDISKIHKEVKNLGNIDGIQPILVFTLKNGTVYTASLKDIVKVDYDKIVSICRTHNIVVSEQ